MHVAVLGTGVVGRTLAAALHDLGHDVVMGTRDPAATLARDDEALTTWRVQHDDVGFATFADAAAGADAQRMTTPQVDALLQRVTALTRLLGDRPGVEWDEIDQLAAQLLMSDLAAIASLTRALNGLSASRLTEAVADLIAAGQDADRMLTTDD